MERQRGISSSDHILVNMKDLEGGGKGRLVKETSGQQEGFFKLKKTHPKTDARDVFGFVSLSSSVKFGSRKQGWRCFRVRRHSSSL